MDTRYNLDKLIKVKILDTCESSWYSYQSPIKVFGFTLRKECIKGLWGPDYEISSPPEHHFLLCGVVYEKPECRLTFEGNHSLKIVYDTLQEAKNKAIDITNGKNYLIV